jgi:hypothetical protein
MRERQEFVELPTRQDYVVDLMTVKVPHGQMVF